MKDFDGKLHSLSNFASASPRSNRANRLFVPPISAANTFNIVSSIALDTLDAGFLMVIRFLTLDNGYFRAYAIME